MCSSPGQARPAQSSPANLVHLLQVDIELPVHQRPEALLALHWAPRVLVDEWRRILETHSEVLVGDLRLDGSVCGSDGV